MILKNDLMVENQMGPQEPIIIIKQRMSIFQPHMYQVKVYQGKQERRISGKFQRMQDFSHRLQQVQQQQRQLQAHIKKQI